MAGQYPYQNYMPDGSNQQQGDYYQQQQQQYYQQCQQFYQQQAAMYAQQQPRQQAQQDLYQRPPVQQQQQQLYVPPQQQQPQQQHQGSYQQQQQQGSHQQQQQSQRNDNQQYNAHQSNPQDSSRSSFKKVQSPLNDFGDMGAAVRNYTVTETKKGGYPNASQGEIPQEDNHPYRKQHGLTAWDDFGNVPIPEPFLRFEDFPGISKQQLDTFYRAGFQSPTPIQAQTWPIGMKERDVVSIAKTGSGKTLAFLLPAYKKIDKFSRNRGSIHALVLAPTRELATQIQEEADKFGRPAGYHSACAYGGAPKRDQLRAINSGISVLVATPGRLNDFIESNQVDLSNVFYLVLDEADRMLDMGFEPQIRSIIKRLPKKRQTLMFSATWPEEVRRLANDFLYQPIHIRLGNTEAGLQANESIQQHLILLRSGEEKDGELVKLIRARFERNQDLVLIFVARKNTCDFVTNMLNRCGIPASAMHGDRDQSYRERTLAAFRNGSKPILVATDVASRGIDVKGISAVINYDLANSSEDYVHRIGRTGRAGMSGESFTFLTHSNEDVWKAVGIVEIMEKNGQRAPPEVQEMIDRLKYRQEQNNKRRDAENQQFQKVLIVAEKPSVAKMIAEHLSGGRFRTRRGQSRANQIFEFIKWFGPAQQKCKLMVTSVVGHIFGLTFENSSGRDVSALFTAKTKKNIEDTTKKLRIVEHLQELGQESDFLYLWLDCDREGENIGFEVISLTQEYVHYDNVYRARFSALTKSELVNAYENPVRPDKYAAMSVDARQELDLKIGVAFSRLMTRSFLNMAKEKFRLGEQRVMSYGPCQTPTLFFCAQRHKEIQNFRPEKYYIVSLSANLYGQQLNMKWEQGDEVTNPHDIQQMESAVQQAQQARVLEVQENKKTVRKPLGLNTVTLLKACSKGLGMSPTSAMHAAEHLYTSGYISYPRTETSAYPPSFDLYGALEEQANHPNWGRVVSGLLHSGKIQRPESGYDVGDHPPITPMMAATRNEITKANEWRVYDYVTRHFIASLHENMEYNEKTLIADVNGFHFKYTWHEVLEKGFTFAMPWKVKGLQLNEARMPPHIQDGTPMQITNFRKVEEYTKPPDYLQESELISLMDKHGIGTDASIPTHIKNVQERNYVDVCGPSGPNGERGQVIRPQVFFGKGKKPNGFKQERPTSRHMVPRGFGLAFLACFEELDMELCEPSIRAYMEKQVTQIATGETEKNEVVSNNLNLFLDKFVRFRDQLERVERFFTPKGQAGGGVFQAPRGGGGRGRGRGGGARGGFSNDSYRQGNNNQYDNNQQSGGGNSNFERPQRGGDRGRGGMSRGGRGSYSSNNSSFKQQQDHSGGFDRDQQQHQHDNNDGGNGRGRGRGRGGYSNNNRGGGRGGFLNNQQYDGQQQNSQRGGRGSYRGNQSNSRGVGNNFNNRGGDNQFNNTNNSNRGAAVGRGGRGGNTGSAPIGQKRGGGSIPPTSVAAKRVHHSY